MEESVVRVLGEGERMERVWRKEKTRRDGETKMEVEEDMKMSERRKRRVEVVVI